MMEQIPEDKLGMMEESQSRKYGNGDTLQINFVYSKSTGRTKYSKWIHAYNIPLKVERAESSWARTSRMAVRFDSTGRATEKRQ